MMVVGRDAARLAVERNRTHTCFVEEWGRVRRGRGVRDSRVYLWDACFRWAKATSPPSCLIVSLESAQLRNPVHALG